jgi:DNA topoisomerase III
MGKQLIIAEKPSVAGDIARSLGGFTRHDDYYENDDYVVSSAVGHLLEIAAPEQYEVKRGKWSLKNLPVIPPHFDLVPIAKSEARLKTLAKLMKRKDVSAIINACDAGREGELIFRYIMQATKSKLAVRRLWLQSMTPASIREGFEKLRSDDEMQPLADAAKSRSEADWIVGINGTRAMTAFNSKDGGFFLTTVGRVQTPTLAVVVERERKIKAFVPRDFWEVKAVFRASAGNYEARWFNPDFKRDENDAERKDSRLWDKSAADAIASACRGRLGVVSEESKPSSQLSPALFDLTSLQREANGRFGFSAKVTLSIAQELYEKHKALTYPRTDSRHLPEDYLDTVASTFEALREHDLYAALSKQVLKAGWIKPNRRIFDNKKISDHFAIIPTPQPPKHLNEIQQKIYDLVTRRFLAVFFPAAEHLVTTRITKVEGHHFKTEGKVLVKPGWLAVYGKDIADSDATLVAVGKGEKPLAEEVTPIGLATKPPARYTEATLLSAMEGAGKLIEDDDLREAMAQKGLGTPATRATIIEGLLRENYLHRDGRELVPTAKAFQLMTGLKGLGINELTQPELTGEWEHKLALMERGKLKREVFMREIADMTKRIVDLVKEYDSDTIPGDYATLKTPCPNCGGVVKENYKRFACEKCGFSISKIPGGRQFEIEEVETLLRDRTLGPLQGLRISRDDENNNHKLEFDFGQGQNGDEAVIADFSGLPALGSCPKCGGSVYEQGMNYVCENTPPKKCDFRSGKVILRQEITPEQMQKLLASGKTDLLDGFVSNRNGRKFKAYLAKQPDGKIGFEFAPRPPKASATKSVTKPATKARKSAAS